MRPLLPWRSALRATAQPWVLALLVIALALGGFGAGYANWEMFGAPQHHSIQGVDDTGYYIWLRSAVIDGDLDFANDLVAAPTLLPAKRDEWLALPRTKSGRVPNKFPPGWAVATLPAFLAGHLVAWLTDEATDGWSRPYSSAVWIYHLLLAGLGLWWAWRIVARFVREDLAAVSVLSLWIASPVIYYSTARVGMAHGLLFTLLAGVTHFTIDVMSRRRAYGRWFLIGVLGGLAVLLRGTAVVYLLYPLAVLFAARRSLPASEWWKLLTAFASPGLVAVLLLLSCNLVLSGEWVAEPYPGEAFLWHRPAVASSLFSPRHGLFYWHPLIFVGVAGLVGAATARAAPRVWLVSVVAIVYVNSAWHAWWFGSSFGNRAYEGIVLLAMVGLGWLLGRAAAWRTRSAMRSLGGIVALAVISGSVWLVLFVVQAIPREDAVTYRDVVNALLASSGG